MAVDFGRRFEDLSKQADAIDASKKYESGGEYGFAGHRIDQNDLISWSVKVRHLLVTVCGETSQHFQEFVKREEPSMYTTNYETFLKQRAVLSAAREDFEGGYLSSLKTLIQSEVFDSELDQAAELLASGYETAAAVIAGVVLETTLREMCTENGLQVGKLDRMNADLAKAGIYNRLRQKQITAFADIRNSAAHGDSKGFKREDVASMIRDIQSFLAER
ncbi:hypothetical protein ACVIIV_003052 [Bradyrhizobium sp. USDA 4354]